MSLSGRNDTGYIDVHQLTPTLRQSIIDIIPSLIKPPTDFSIELIDDRLKEIMKAYVDRNEKYNDEVLKKISIVLEKIYNRCKSATPVCNYIDHDLGGINIFFLLEAVWALVVIKESYDEFLETLLEMGTLCPQGDSHRLMLLYLALK